MLEIKNLTKRYDETIIKNLNIILPSTGLIIIVGNSFIIRSKWKWKNNIIKSNWWNRSRL